MALKSSLKNFEDFKESRMWIDLHNVLTDRLRVVRDALEQEENMDQIRMLQGASDQLRYMLSLPDQIIEELSNKGEVR